ncbi:unnamed protein product [Cylindrotheca closterium]|uniref:CRAL-TRIO domain-containing protein n=1 Tax=Cylindrotheca closterium TaxID=2856 RepID=A0AAD2FDW1_9STRA|nr:unnamed protein product [Cylindrotheca closterium]
MEEEDEVQIEERIKESGYKGSFPQTEEEANAVDDLLANELAELSLLEQDKATFDLHGISTEIEETEELIESSLKEMEKEIHNIKKKPAFEKAVKLNPNYVNSRQFRIRFLRCEFFKCKNAAKRLVFHFEKKEVLFGDGEVLGRDVHLSDLSSPQDIEHVKSGGIQVLPTRDIAGRSVLLWMPGNFKGKKYILKSTQRLFYYVVDSASREEETQKKGFVTVFWNIGPRGMPPTIALFKNLHAIRLAMPHRMCGLHFCFDYKALRPMVSGMRYFMDKHARKRFRVHYGDEQKVAFQLQTYGIPFDDGSPMKVINGQFNLTWHQNWLQLRQAQEGGSTDQKQRITIPHRFDVLFGRGNNAREHTGNLRATHLVNMHQKNYDEANRFAKTSISEKLVGIIKESGGKFLKWEDSGWVEVEDDIARDKVSHWFRLNRQKGNQKEASVETQKQKRPFNQTLESSS